MGKWAAGADGTYDFKRDYTFTYEWSQRLGLDDFIGGTERGTYDFDGSTLTLHIKSITNSREGAVTPQVSWQRYSFQRDKDLATVAFIADDSWMPQLVEERKKLGKRPPDYVHWLPVPFGSH